MKFNDLYNRVFIKEQDEQPSEVASPEDFNVEPAPVPEAPAMPTDEEAVPAIDVNEVADLESYIIQATELSNKLVSSNGDDLLSKISKLDRPGTQFENIYGSLKSNLLRASEALSDLASQLLVYKNAPKR
jgi:hypothetical protein